MIFDSPSMGEEKIQALNSQNQLSLNLDFKQLIEGLTLPMNEEQLYRNQKS